MRNLKVAVIGSGSTYTPELIMGFIKCKESLKIHSFYMMDIDCEKNEIVCGLAKRMLEHHGIKSEIVLTDCLEEAIEGADYVLGQIRVGGLDARINDEKIPLKYNLLGQETTGAGGFMKALRTIPVMKHIAKKIEELAPDAWLINFSNPSGIIAEMLLNHTNVKMIGLCNVPINMIKSVREMLPSETKEFDYQFVGLNHLCWITKVEADGKSMKIPSLLMNSDGSTVKNIPSISYDAPIINAIDAIPCGYLNYYYFRDETVKKCKEAELVRGEACKKIEKELLELYQAKEVVEKPAILDQRGGALYSEAAVALVDSIENDRNECHVVNVKNNGAYDFMDDDDIVEVKCVINRHGAIPVKEDIVTNEHIKGLMQSVKAYEKLTVKACLDGNYNRALEALLAHPLVGDYMRARQVLDEMIEANREYLPEFN